MAYQTHPTVKCTVYKDDLLTVMITKVVRHGPMLTAIKRNGFMQIKVRGPGSLELVGKDERKKIFTILMVQIVFMDVWLIDRYPGVDYEYES